MADAEVAWMMFRIQGNWSERSACAALGLQAEALLNEFKSNQISNSRKEDVKTKILSIALTPFNHILFNFIDNFHFK